MNEPLIPGKRYRVTFEGTANEYGALRFDRAPGDRVSRGAPVSAIRNNATSIERLPDPAPAWAPGDVVVIRFTPCSEGYTYVRGRRDWPGDGARKSDAEVSRLWREGKVEVRLQAGGALFDEDRLPVDPITEVRDRLTRPARRPVYRPPAPYTSPGLKRPQGRRY